MAAPDMRAYLEANLGRTFYTVALNRPNTVVSLTDRRAVVRTESAETPASIADLQRLADRVYAGEIVQVETRGRSAFDVAVLVTLPGVAYALNPRRVWLEGYAAIDAEFDDLETGVSSVRSASEGRELYRRHRLRERSQVLVRAKKAQALGTTGRLACEVCGFDFAERYPDVGTGFIECHHLSPLSDNGERETTLDELALVCANCHRMLHRRLDVFGLEDLRRILRDTPR